MGERKDGMQNAGKKERDRASGKELARNNEWERSWRERIGGKELAGNNCRKLFSGK
jgi:hypothetical protein